MKETVKFVLVAIIGFLIGWFFPMVDSPEGGIEPSIYKLEADSLRIELDSIKGQLYEDSVAYYELINNHRDEIDSIDTLSLHNLYELWSGQHADKSGHGTARGLYK